MKGAERTPRSPLWVRLALGLLVPSRLRASIEYDVTIPQLAFAAQELNVAFEEANRSDLRVS